jgi:nicotinamidase-related amidase
MVGPIDENDQTEYPSACASARKALPVIARLAETFRSFGWPVFYTQNLTRKDGRDMGMRLLKRGILNIDGWYLEGTRGAEIVREIAPKAEDIVLRKIKPSAFHGTPLVGLLISAGIDTVVVVGGSTSNCVRATVIDSVSYNFRTIVPNDAVFDRVQLSHEVSLMDIDRQLGDVMTSDEVIACVSALPPRAKRIG